MTTLQHFVGKVCTIFTTPINRDYQSENPGTYPEQLINYFVGVVDGVDNNGMVLTQLTTGLKTWFSMKHVVSIAEEEVLDPKDQRHAEIISGMKPVPKVDRPDSAKTAETGPYVDIGELEQLSKLRPKVTLK